MDLLDFPSFNYVPRNQHFDAANHILKRLTSKYCYKITYFFIASNKFKVLNEW